MSLLLYITNPRIINFLVFFMVTDFNSPALACPQTKAVLQPSLSDHVQRHKVLMDLSWSYESVCSLSVHTLSSQEAHHLKPFAQPPASTTCRGWPKTTSQQHFIACVFPMDKWPMALALPLTNPTCPTMPCHLLPLAMGLALPCGLATRGEKMGKFRLKLGDVSSQKV